jgi:outer membrane protein assembly factor BamB
VLLCATLAILGVVAPPVPAAPRPIRAAAPIPGWDRFRGPNGTGVADQTAIPDRLDPESNLAWKQPLPPGYSSPVLTADHVFVTANEGRDLYVVCLDRATGEEVYRTPCPEPLKEDPKGPNSPVAPTPATDGANLFVFFPTYGLLSLDAAGAVRWTLPLGPFNNPYGMGASPILAGDLLVMQCDQDTDSYLLAVRADRGEVVWRTPRPGSTHGFSTPILHTPAGGPAEIVVSGSYETAGYLLEDGRKHWWVSGLAWQAKSVPVIRGDVLYVQSWMAGVDELGLKTKVTDSWDEVRERCDADGDGKLSKEEAPDPAMPQLWFLYDLDKDGGIDAHDWEYQLARTRAENGLYAIQLGGEGNLTASAVLWRNQRALPNIPSPLLYGDVLYLLKEGGILSAYDPVTGAAEGYKQGRIEEAIGTYYASPIVSAGRLVTASHPGRVAVIEAGKEWEVLSVTDFGEEIWATPAVSDGQVFVRTQQALYCFEE